MAAAAALEDAEVVFVTLKSTYNFVDIENYMGCNFTTFKKGDWFFRKVNKYQSQRGIFYRCCESEKILLLWILDSSRVEIQIMGSDVFKVAVESKLFYPLIDEEVR